MDRMEQWKLLDSLNIYQIALLMTGYDPSEFAFVQYTNWNRTEKENTAAILQLLKNAVSTDVLRLNKEVFHEYGEGGINWEESLILVEELRAWLRTKNSPDRFFVRSSGDTKAVTNPNGEFYAPKLAAAIKAWSEVSGNPSLRKGKSVKQAIEDWLRAHAAEYDLMNKDGTPNLGGIEQICKVANWQPKGGAPATPIAIPEPAPEPAPQILRRREQVNRNRGVGSGQPDLDDEIPF
eukprot:gene20262-20839_t